MVVTHIGVASVAKIYGAISASFGLLIGIVVALASLIGAGVSASEDTIPFAPLLGVGAVVALPILYGVMGLIAGAVGALLYNVFAGLVGGVRLDVK